MNIESVVALAPTLRMNAAELRLVEGSYWAYPLLNHIYTEGYTHLNGGKALIDSNGDEQELKLDNSWTDYTLGTGICSGVLLESISRWLDDWFATWANWSNAADNVWGYNFSASTSLKLINHYSQIMKEMDVVCFNYLDGDINTAAYGQVNPPNIPLDMVNTVPIMLVSADNDNVAAPSDVMWLHSVLAENYSAADLVYWNIEGGHNTPLQAMDMTYWDSHVMPFINAKIQSE